MGTLNNAENSDRFGLFFDDETVGVMSEAELQKVRASIRNQAWVALEKAGFNPETSLELVGSKSLAFIEQVLNQRIKNLAELAKFSVTGSLSLEAIPAFFNADETVWGAFKATRTIWTAYDFMSYMMLDKIKESKIKDLTIDNINGLIDDVAFEKAFREAIFKYGFVSGKAETSIEHKLVAIRNNLFLSTVEHQLLAFLPAPNMPYKVWQKKIKQAAENPATLIEFVNDPRNSKRIQAVCEKADTDKNFSYCVKDLIKFFNAVKGETFEEIEAECRKHFIGA